MTEIIDACAIRTVRWRQCRLMPANQNIPTRSYQLWGRIAAFPPTTIRSTVSTAACGTAPSRAGDQQPAWVFFDIVTNDRFGLGHRVPLDWVDKWRLYQIARYCDELVSDGQAAREPRFTCSLYLQTRAEAYRVLQDIATMFRGISFYGRAGDGLGRHAQGPGADHSQANVIEGRFHYAGSSRTARHTVALVSWIDPDDFGRQKVEVVQHPPGAARYGINQTEVTAVGCHSRSQAQRVGSHIRILRCWKLKPSASRSGCAGLHAR